MTQLATVTASSAIVHETPIGMLTMGQYDLVHKIAESAFAAGLARNADEAFVKMIRGHELGIPLMTALNAIHLIEGKLAYDATFMEALARRQSTTEKFECLETTDERCVYIVKRSDWTREQRVEWTIEKAANAGLMDRGKDEAAKKRNNWQKYPAQMLRARAKADGARLVAPEALHAMYCHEELADGAGPKITEGPPAAAAIAEASEAAGAALALASALVARIKAASTDDDRKAIRRDIKAAGTDGRLVGQHYELVVAQYDRRWPAPAVMPPAAGATAPAAIEQAAPAAPPPSNASPATA